MAIDYEQIRKDNIVEYGKGTRHLAVFERLYSDGTHFIFELLQNAEDAKANRIQFALFGDRLEVRHDGRQFNERDVRGVSGVGESTKQDDLTQIGQFGLGFKSVYAFTKTPQIHCVEEHFEIRDYVRPHAVPPRPVAKPWTTLIIIPFNKGTISPEYSETEIAKRLRRLSARTLLFLDCIQTIEYEVGTSEQGAYSKTPESCIDSRLLTLLGESSREIIAESEQWLVFEKFIRSDDGEIIVGPNGSPIPPVQVAFLLKDPDGAAKRPKQDSKAHSGQARSKQPWAGKDISALTTAPLVVFFPTERESRLGFLVQGPYRTTPARDNIPFNDEWNLRLVKETADLMALTVLPKLKEMGLLTISSFDAFPIEMEHFPEDGFFYPLAAAVRAALSSKDLLPAADGTFVSGEKSVLGRGEELRTLLDNSQLTALFGLAADVKWLSGEITADKAPKLRTYLRDELKVIEVTPESLPPKISNDFMKTQTDEWVTSFYGCLLAWEALWKMRRDVWNRSTLRDRPFLRLEDGSHVTPFDGDGHPNAYLPLKGITNLPLVRRDVASDKMAREFLTRLGITEPDIVAEVIEELLPLYHNEAAMPTASQHSDHMKEILTAWSTDSIVKKKRLEEKLRETPFVRFHCPATGAYGYAKPADIYFRGDELLLYFEGCQDARFALTSYTKDVRELLGHLGVAEVPRSFEVNYGDPPYVHRSTGGVSIRNYVLHGLETHLVRIGQEQFFEKQREMSLILWTYLISYANTYNIFQATRRYFYYQSRYQAYDSLITKKLRETAWLPTNDGTLVKPPTLSIDRLAEGFEPHQKLVSALGLQPDPSEQTELEKLAKRNLASQLGINLEDADFIREFRAAFDQFKTDVATRQANKDQLENSPEKNRERRRKKLQERRAVAPERKSVRKLRSVAGYSTTDVDEKSLISFYHNEDDSVFCQICLDCMPFKKRDGGDYCECTTLWTESWAKSKGIKLKVMTPLNLILCPICSSFFNEYVHKDHSFSLQEDLFHEITGNADGTAEITLCCSRINDQEPDRVIHFDPTHLADIRDCMEQEDE